MDKFTAALLDVYKQAVTEGDVMPSYGVKEWIAWKGCETETSASSGVSLNSVDELTYIPVNAIDVATLSYIPRNEPVEKEPALLPVEKPSCRRLMAEL